MQGQNTISQLISSPRIGFVGVGNMGGPMAMRLLQAGYDVRVYDTQPERMAPLTALGAEQAFHLSEVAEAGGIVLSMVPDDSALLKIALGADGEIGLVEQLGAGGVHVSLSTVSPQVSQSIAHYYAEYGVAFLAGNVLGRPEVAAAGTLSILLAGPAEAKERVKSLLASIGTHIHDLGEKIELANIAKLAINFLIVAALEAMSEGANLVERYGLSRELYLDIAAQSPLFHGSRVYEGYGAMIGSQDYTDARFPLPLGLKDANLMLAAATQVHISLPVAELALQAMQRAQEANGDNSKRDWSVLGMYPPIIQDAAPQQTVAALR